MRRTQPPPNKKRYIEFFDENKAQRMGLMLKEKESHFIVRTAMGDIVHVRKDKVARDFLVPSD